MNYIEAFERVCIINKQNYIQNSEELKIQNMWFNTNQSIDVYTKIWFRLESLW